MLVATFGADTAWSGRRILHEEGRFVLEGFGAVSAAQVLDYDRVTPLVWSTGGTRAWVRSVAHQQGGAAGAAAQGAARPAASQPGRPAPGPPGPEGDGPQAAPSLAVRPPAGAARPEPDAARLGARPPEVRFARAHYVGGQPSLGPSLAGTMLVSARALALGGAGGDPAAGPSVPLHDVAKVSLYAGQVLGAREAEDRTFLVAHLRPRGWEAFALDGVAPEDVRLALASVLSEAAVHLEGCAPSGRASPTIDEVQRLGELHARGTLTDDEFRAALAPVLTGQAVEPAESRVAAPPGRVPDAAREAALDRLSQLRLSGAITDAELAAMRAKLLE